LLFVLENEVSGIFSRRIPAFIDVRIASFLLVSSVLVLVFFTSYYYWVSSTVGSPPLMS